MSFILSCLYLVVQLFVGLLTLGVAFALFYIALRNWKCTLTFSFVCLSAVGLFAYHVEKQAEKQTARYIQDQQDWKEYQAAKANK